MVCKNSKETQFHLLTCDVRDRVWCFTAWKLRDVIEDLMENAHMPDSPPPGWFLPHLRGVQFIFMHAFSPPEHAVTTLCQPLLQLAFIFTLHRLWRERVNMLFHNQKALPPIFLFSTTLNQLIQLVKYRKVTRPGSMNPPDWPPGLGRLEECRNEINKFPP